MFTAEYLCRLVSSKAGWKSRLDHQAYCRGGQLGSLIGVLDCLKYNYQMIKFEGSISMVEFIKRSYYIRLALKGNMDYVCNEGRQK